MKITVTPGSEQVTRKIVAATGGSLTLTASNGDTFELTIPPHSLPQNTEVSLQRVNVSHPQLSATANYSSVEISPDGVDLIAPATLVFRPKRAFPMSALTPFSAQADGDETHLAFLVGNPTPAEIRVGLLHFSNYTISAFDPINHGPIEGSINVESAYFNLTDFTCEQTALHTRPSTLEIYNFLTQKNADENFRVTLRGLEPYSVATFRCVNNEDPEVVITTDLPPAEVGSYWGGMFTATHGPTGTNERDQATASYLIRGWQVRHDVRYAVREYTQSIEGLNEATTMIIYHTPDPL